MNTIKYNTPEGFPLDTTNLNFLQNSLKLMQAFGEFAGNLSIISGCTTSGSQVSNGVVYIDGELLEFRGGNKSTYVIIKESEEKAEFENGEKKVIEVTRYVTFGSASKRWKWADFKRPSTLPALNTLIETTVSKTKHIVPVGLISMWAGTINNIPAGWKLCNGSNGTPNLTDRFILGTATNADIGKTGGEEEVTLTKAQMPKHSHTGGSTSSAGSHTHSYQDTIIAKRNSDLVGSMPIGTFKTTMPAPFLKESQSRKADQEMRVYRNVSTSTSGAHSHTISGLSSEGESESHNNMPPYYKLAFIQYKG